MMNRKTFLKNSSLGALGLMAHPYIVSRQAAKYNLVLIGTGWWGTNILREAIRSGEVKVTALCDVDDAQIKKCQEEVNKLCDDRPKVYKDFRECLEKEKPQIAIVATPDHWHALIAIEAMNQGAHVFLENPSATQSSKGQPSLKLPEIISVPV